MKEKWECKRCGLCCKWVIHRFGGDEEAIRYYKMHKNFTVIYSDVLKQNVVLIKSRCEHLNENNLCDIYEDRPSACKEFDAECCDLMRGFCEWGIFYI